MAFLSGAFAWVSNAVHKATETVKKVVNTVKKANDIVETVNNASVSAVRKATASKAHEVQTGRTWRDDYIEATEALRASVND